MLARAHRLFALVPVTAMLAALVTPTPSQAAPQPPPPSTAPSVPGSPPAAPAAAPSKAPSAAPSQAGPRGVTRAPAAAAAAGPAHYAYDAAGRLLAVTHVGGETARYHYDPAGNVTSVERYPSSRLTVLSLVPATVRRGERITIHGTGFATDPHANVVKIGGAPMPVQAATPTALTVLIPAMSGNGPVTVQVGGTTATGPTFTLAPAGPVINGISPDSGLPGTEATITGSGFDPVPTNNVVTIHGMRVEVFAASATSLRVRIPVTTSGGVRVATPAGTSGGPTFFVPLPDIDPRLIDSYEHIYPGFRKTAQVTTSGHRAVIAFTAPERGMLSLGLTGSTFTGAMDLRVFDPDGEELRDWFGRAGSAPTDIDFAGLRPGKTYQLLVEPDDGVTGRVTVHASEPLFAEATSFGPGFVADLAVPGQDVRLAFDASAGQAVSLAFTASTLRETMDVSLLDPRGERVGHRFSAGPTSNESLDVDRLDEPGRYTAVVDPRDADVGRVTVTLSARIEAGTVTTTGDPVGVLFQRQGQDAVVRFAGTRGGALNLAFVDARLDAYTDVTVYGPDGKEVPTYANIPTEGAETVRLRDLPATGTYRVVLSPRESGRGQVRAVLSAPVAAGTATTTGGAVSVVTSRAGQDAVVEFGAAADATLSLGLTGGTYGETVDVTVVDAAGKEVADGYLSNGSAGDDVDLPPLAAGRYRALVEPRDAATGRLAVTLSAQVSGGTLVRGGAARTVTITRRGQDGRFTFEGTAGQRLQLKGVRNTFTEYSKVYLVTPDGTRDPVYTLGAGGLDVLLPDLPATATYQLILDPSDALTGVYETRLVTRPAGRATAAGSARAAVTAATAATGAATAAHRARPDAAAPRVARPAPADAALSWTPDPANLRGADWSTRRRAVAAPTPLRAAAGSTALSGHTYTIDGKPLAGVTVSAGGVTARTDRTGRFLLAGLPGGATTVTVDGTTANTARRTFGVYSVRADVPAGRTTVLPYTIWMQVLDRQHAVRIDAPTRTETVVTTPKIPGLEIRIPAGAVVRDAHGNVVRELSITPIPADRPPFPLPETTMSPVYFTVQPGGAFVFPDGARVVYPNTHGLPAGTVVDFESYDPQGKGWHVYGKGTVTADGRQIVPDAASKVWSFQMFSAFKHPLLGGWDLGRLGDVVDWLSGDPVDLATGMMVDSHTDLMLPDVMPLAVTRRYYQGDPEPREFGVGQSSQYHVFLTSRTLNALEVDLYLPGGEKIHFARTTPGDGGDWEGVTFVADRTAGQWRGARLECLTRRCFAGPGWKLTRRDGTKLYFPWGANAVSAIEDRHGNRIDITRDDNLQVKHVRSSSGKWLSFTHANGRIATARDSTGRVVTYGYTNGGRLERVTGPGDRVLSYTYDTEGRLKTATDARGITYLTNEFDTAGRVKRQILPDGRSYRFAYVPADAGPIQATQVTEPDGAVRRVTFNADGAVLTDTQAHGTPLAQTTTYHRDAQNVVTGITDHAGRRSTFAVDADGNPRSVTALAGTADAATSGVYTYGGPFDQPSTYTDRNGKVTTFSYDDRGDLESVKDPLGRVTGYTWNAAGQLATVRDPAGRTTTLHYRDGDLVSVTDPGGRRTKQFVDAAGRPSAITDAAGSTTHLVHDALNRVGSVVDPLGAVTRFDYDRNGNLEKLTDPRGKVTTWTYDASDRVDTWTDARGEIVDHDYGPRSTTVTARSGKKSRIDTDLLGRVELVSYGVTGAGAESTLTPAYDDKGRLFTVTDSATRAVTTYDYDPLDRIKRVTGSEGATSYTYWPTGEVRTVTAAGQPTVEYGYDDGGAPTTAARGAVAAEYRYDDAGTPTGVNLPGGWSSTVRHDDAGRVERITYKHGAVTKGTLTYTYDDAGRILSTGGSLAKVALPAARTATYDDANRLRTHDGVTVTHDDDGNLRNDGTNTYTWDSRGRLTGITGGAPATFGYGPDGERTQRTVAGATTRFLGDRGQPIVERRGAAATAVLSGGTDQWLHRSEGGGRTYLTDLAGSTVALGDAAGALQAQYAYDPSGVPTVTGDPGTNPFTYTGREDDGTGLMYYRARYYSPALQRFVSEDPIGFAGGTNLYAYAANAPTNFTDPQGTNPLLVGCIAGGLAEGFLDWGAQRLAGRKVDWGWGGVGGAAALGCAMGAAGAWLNGVFKGAKGAGGLDGPSCPIRNSFTADTEVVLADGTRKRIADVRPDMQVLAVPEHDPGADPKPRAVETVIQDTGLKDLVRISAGGEELVATEGHEFWLPREGRWAEAGGLQPGQWLRTSAGTYVQVTAVGRTTAWTTVHNLKVDGYHTYFVGSGTSPVLVHNCGGNLKPGNSGAAARGTSVHNGPEWGRHLDNAGYQRGGPLSSGDIPDGFTAGGFPVELKPDTASGIKAGTRQLRRYMNQMGVDYGELWTYTVDASGDVTFRLARTPKSSTRWLRW